MSMGVYFFKKSSFFLRRALVTILEEEPYSHETALLSEAALAKDWNRPEDAAGSHLQPAR